MKVPKRINTLVEPLGITALGFVYKGMINSTRHRYEFNEYRINVDVGKAQTWLSVRYQGGKEYDFTTRAQLLKLLVGLGCIEAVAAQRADKINSVLL